MKRISGGQLSLGANATLLSSHAGGPRAAAGDTSFAGQAKQSTQQSRVSPPPAREPTGQAGRQRPSHKDDDSDRSLPRVIARRLVLVQGRRPAGTDRDDRLPTQGAVVAVAVKRTLAMAAGVADHVWTMTEIASLLDQGRTTQALARRERID